MSHEAIDVTEVLERVQNDYELLIELLDIFQEDYKEKRQAFDVAIQRKSSDELRNLAHSLKGASSNISAKKIHDLFAQLEHMAEEGQWEHVDNLVGQIDTTYRELLDFIIKFKKKMKGL